MMPYEHYIRSTIGRIFKLLPLREQADSEFGSDVFLDVYIEDLASDVVGAMMTFPELQEVSSFVSAANILNYMKHYWKEMPFSTYRSSILKMTNGLSKVVGEEVTVE